MILNMYPMINPQNDNFEYGNPLFNALLQSRLKLENCKQHKGVSHPTKCDVINDVKLFPTIYCRIHCGNFLRYPIRYKIKCIRIQIYTQSFLI